MSRLTVLTLILIFLGPRASSAQSPSAAEMVEVGVSELLEMMAGDHWQYGVSGTPNSLYDVAITAVCAEAALLAPGYDCDTSRQDAISLATQFILDHGSNSTGCLSGHAGWQSIFALRYLVRLKATGRVPAGKETAVDQKIMTYVDSIETCFTPPPPGAIITQAGMPYDFDSPVVVHAPFMTAPALLALKDAEDTGFSVNATAVDNALASLEASRVPATHDGLGSVGPDTDAFTYQSDTNTPAGCLPPSCNYSTGRATIPGSVSRMAACETALLVWDESPNPSTAGVNNALNKFFDEANYALLLAQKGHGGHSGDFQIADYYFFYSHYYAAVGIETIGRTDLRDDLEDLIRDCRQVDGRWNDSQHALNATHGTAAAVLALVAPNSLSGVSIEHDFIRGDANADGNVDLSDASRILDWAYNGTAEVCCRDAADVNDDGSVNTTDPLYIYGFLFLGTKPPPPPPYPNPGPDPTQDGLECEFYPTGG